MSLDVESLGFGQKMIQPLKQVCSMRLMITMFFLLMAAALVISMTLTRPQAGRAASAAGPDLVVSIRIDPAAPGIGEEVTVKMEVKNIGTSTAGPSTLYLYIDPPDRPPTQTTLGRPFGLASLPANGQAPEASFTDNLFSEGGCDHVIYAWIDRDNAVAESDESNNLVELQVCVDVECQPDSFEDDNLCSAAGMLIENVDQARSFCHAQNPTDEDEDWVKFTTFAGVTYTLATSNQGVHASPQLELYDACGAFPPLRSGANQVTWQAQDNSVLFAKLANQGGVIGPLSAYSLTLSSATGVSDDFEPDNRCADARDISTDGTPQSHRFQSPGDEDWVRFAINAGQSFIVVASNPGTGVEPLVTVFASCSDAANNNSLGPTAAQVSQSSTNDGVFVARVKNQAANVFGQNATYDLAVTAGDCAPDAEEDDDSPAQAKTVTVGGAARTHNACPASDEDWVKFTAQTGKVYVLQTLNLAAAADTVLHLYNIDGSSQLAQNDDYGYTSGSRLVWEAPGDGVYFAKVHHANLVASGPNTQYDFVIQEGVCSPDPFEANAGNNGPGDAPLAPTNGVSQTHNFCADALNSQLGDQDWLALNAVSGGQYQIVTSGLGPNSDTVLELYAADGETQLLRNDDAGQGRGASLSFTAGTPGPYFVRVTQYNTNLIGNDADYQVQVFATEPPTPTPTPTFTPTPTATPSPTATPPPSTANTVIVVNHQRVSALYGAGKANSLLNKLVALADDPDVNGVILQVENDPAIAAAYAAWTADSGALADQQLANAVAAAIRNRVMAFLSNAPDARYVLLVGDDRVIPFRRVLDRTQPRGQSAASVEPNYAPDVVEDGTIRAALAANMVLTDDYYGDREASHWQDRQQNQYDLYLPDYAVGRLIEDPDEMIGVIDYFLAGNKRITTNRALVTGYDFVQDSAALIRQLFNNDTINTDGELIGASWTGNALRSKYLQASPRFDVYSVNGHSTHLAAGVPDEDDMTAAQISAAAVDLRGSLVFSLGCHGGLNEPGALDLPQAFVQKQAHYIGNTGFGWGSGGVIFSEALMRNYTIELLRNTESSIGISLSKAKQRYYSQASRFDAFDAKVIMQMTFYGLPMVMIQTGGTLTDEDPFPSADAQFTPPSSLAGIAQGAAGYRLPDSFAAFGAETSQAGTTYTLDGNVAFGAGEPLQPLYYTNVSAPAAGSLRGALFLGGVYSDTANVDPVIGVPENEYATDRSEPAFASEDFFPAAPFAIRSSDTISGAKDMLVMSLGQFKSSDELAAAATGQGTVRVFDQMSFGVYYSNSPDRNAANIDTIDGVLDPDAGIGRIKVAANDSSGIHRVVVAFTQDQGQWFSKDLSFDPVTVKWTGEITGTPNTRFFVQVVDNAGNVAVNENKGRYYQLDAPLQLAEGRAIVTTRRLWLPLVSR
jgi:hypothetical protein